jgi:hypothetical protein
VTHATGSVMGTQIIEARNKIHKVEAQNKKTRKVEQTIQPSKKKPSKVSKQFTE